MDFVRGSIVISKAGHDKGRIMVVDKVSDRFAYVCDGKERPTEKPKLKNLKHLCLTSKVIEMPQTNKQLKKMLNSFSKID